MLQGLFDRHADATFPPFFAGCAAELAAAAERNPRYARLFSYAAALCRVLLVPGDWAPSLDHIAAETVVTYGLSHRDSLTLSSLTEPVLCVQRQLPRPDGAVIEPQEFPLPDLPGPAAELLPLLGLRLLQLPQTKEALLW